MDIRKAFLDYFASKNHTIYPSAPLVPEDPTLLFTNAGMVPFKKIFTGEIPAEVPRATSCQTCIRAGGKHNDLENVGYTARHHTFFEMLGNFSFGDYFKEEAIAYAWEFVTEVLELPVERLWVTVHESDDEAEKIWQKFVKKDRIRRFGDKDNFWQMGDTGPCGPCSEIFYDQGEEHFNGPEDYLGGDGDRFLEIWNLVFMQYERNEAGELLPLPKPSIDTGMGLERITAIKEGVFSNYDSSLFMPIINAISELANKKYIYKEGASFRVIADHIRAVTFLLAQGVMFSNEGRGYVLRRILRRGVRHGYLLGLKEPFMYKLASNVADLMGKHYDYLPQKLPTVQEQIRAEEERFYQTIEAGMKLFEEELSQTKETFSGDVAFKLYDTYGFPLDLTEDMLREKGLKLDKSRFEALMQEQRQRAKAAWKGSGDVALSGDFKELLGLKNEFVGYEKLKAHTIITGLLDENFKKCNALQPGQKGWILLEETPFYAESGGQIGDRGEIRLYEGETVAKVLDTKKFFDLNLSLVEAVKEVKKDEAVEAIVDKSRREIAKHHSATHILHSALRRILGEHVTQQGSLVEANRLRFDFSHPKPLSADEIQRVENFVNEVIAQGIEAKVEEMPIERAKEKGAMALFGEKYGDVVRVVEFGDVSVELCGGTHVKNSAEIGSFFITKESGVSSGVRRIEAVCGMSAVNLAKSWREEISLASEEVKNKDVVIGIKKLKEEIKTLKEELKNATKVSAKELKAQEINGVKVVIDEIDGGDIKKIIDDLKNAYEKIAVMLFQKKENKVLIAAGAKGVGLKAGEWVKAVAPIVGGGGGGRPDFAQAGGKDPSKIAEAKEAALAYAKEHLKEA
ncbi:alanine--tRNA ligase [Nitratiruptor tergarcus]|uniref:Alanine--tRNA ligase n=1 Tax=Nitratiruptor tergarcus DSM 16512 TaxID=1069081 RepID=A0A1W1WPT9_9BACT|nr:alanine--tRNA ligase [Nitratiruptor tergarcus]SMC08334.1 alanyl-tRNA synthetase [Nitratiruptor tergarcus DSM 16512]